VDATKLKKAIELKRDQARKEGLAKEQATPPPEQKPEQKKGRKRGRRPGRER
jgi:hypothetical protein